MKFAALTIEFPVAFDITPQNLDKLINDKEINKMYDYDMIV